MASVDLNRHFSSEDIQIAREQMKNTARIISHEAKVNKITVTPPHILENGHTQRDGQ